MSPDHPLVADYVADPSQHFLDSKTSSGFELSIHHKVLPTPHQINHASPDKRTAVFGHILMEVVVIHQTLGIPEESLEDALR